MSSAQSRSQARAGSGFAKLDVVQLGIERTSRQQFVVSAALSQVRVFHDEDGVGVQKRRQM